MVNLDNLFSLIKERGITAKKLSDDTGISTGNISDWKSGRSMPTAIKLDVIADYLDCSVDYLLGRTELQTFDEMPKGLDAVLMNEIKDFTGKQKQDMIEYAHFKKTQQGNGAFGKKRKPFSGTRPAQVAAYGHEVTEVHKDK